MIEMMILRLTPKMSFKQACNESLDNPGSTNSNFSYVIKSIYRPDYIVSMA